MRFSRHTSSLKMQRARYPSRQLNSKTIRSAALCYLSPVFLGKCSVISAKCVCDVQEEGFENAWNNVCRNRVLFLFLFFFFLEEKGMGGGEKSFDPCIDVLLLVGLKPQFSPLF